MDGEKEKDSLNNATGSSDNETSGDETIQIELEEDESIRWVFYFFFHFQTVVL